MQTDRQTDRQTQTDATDNIINLEMQSSRVLPDRISKYDSLALPITTTAAVHAAAIAAAAAAAADDDDDDDDDDGDDGDYNPLMMRERCAVSAGDKYDRYRHTRCPQKLCNFFLCENCDECLQR